MPVRLVIVFGLPVWVALAADQAPARWSVELNGKDVTAAASPRVHGGKVLVNLSALAPLLGLSVQAMGRETAIRDATGAEWRGLDGGTELLSGPRRLQLALPLLLEGASLFVPMETVSTLSGLAYTADESGRRIRLGDGAPRAAAVPEGWEPLTVQRTPREKDDFERTWGLGAGAGAAAKRMEQFPNQPPPERDVFRLQIGQGYVQGADGGSELMGSGRIAGFETSMNSFLTEGRKGLQLLNGRATVMDPETGRELQGGDLFSEVWGLARGVRYAQPLAGGQRASLGVYLQTRQGGPIRPVFSLTDNWQIGKYAAVAGEVDSDRSHFVKGQFGNSRFTVSGYYRHAMEAQGKGFGVLGSYNLFRRISMQGRFSRQGEGTARLDWRSVSVQVPLVAHMDLTLEHILLDSPVQNERMEVARISIPVRRVRVSLRYQNRAVRLAPAGLGYREALQGGHDLISQVSFFTRRFSIDFQGSTQWRRDGSHEQLEHLIARYQISKRTELQFAGAFPDIMAPQNLLAGIKHQFSETVSATVEYGAISPYQDYRYVLPKRLFRVMLRKDFKIGTATQGGEARGRVADSQNRPVASALVRLGPYSAATDENGGYSFKHVPKGEYTVRLEEKSLGADYLTDDAFYQFHSGRGAKSEFDFAVSSMDAIRGAVYIDENRDGKRGEKEGMPRAAVHMDDKVTATLENGVFAFANVKPGVHTVRLNTDLLPRDLEPDSPVSVEVTLEPGRPVTGIEFRLKRKIREVKFQELKENRE